MTIWAQLYVLAMLGMSVLTFSLMGADKRRARQGRWRIRERTLFWCAVLLGAPGGTAGMFCFRHKTRHLSFRVVFPALTVAQVLGLFYLMMR